MATSEAGATLSGVDPHPGSVAAPGCQSAATGGDHGRGGESGSPVDWRDRVRWGPVWAGAIVVLTTFLVLQLVFFALGLLDLGSEGAGGSGTTEGVITAVLALIAFFVGGLLAGASTLWRGAGDGLLHGVLVWALSVLGILALAVVGGSTLLGPLADLVAQTGAQPQNVDVDPAQVLRTARETAGWTALGLGLAVAAAALGGTLGSKIWPGRRDIGTAH